MRRKSPVTAVYLSKSVLEARQGRVEGAADLFNATEMGLVLLEKLSYLVGMANGHRLFKSAEQLTKRARKGILPLRLGGPQYLGQILYRRHHALQRRAHTLGDAWL